MLIIATFNIPNSAIFIVIPIRSDNDVPAKHTPAAGIGKPRAKAKPRVNITARAERPAVQRSLPLPIRRRPQAREAEAIPPPTIRVEPSSRPLLAFEP
ncbi:hypothetical protein DXG03_005623 [Asterophora parasitica]|uniref:Uncharacterized protein n=1 Tax=Asterophora parasitica TaxID=117018 RepID=A0A9P7G7Q5_9AGAR|nr:hypothetical protein DXG03_005623 [Asterophora parasitica]